MIVNQCQPTTEVCEEACAGTFTVYSGSKLGVGNIENFTPQYIEKNIVTLQDIFSISMILYKLCVNILNKPIHRKKSIYLRV